MTDPQCPQRGPYVLLVQPGTYAWCACGRSKKQPYCDGSHAGSSFVPVIEIVDEPKRVAWCGCKRSKTKPYCDGTHATLP
jgi:CDGSH-type Zn-finger protein